MFIYCKGKASFNNATICWEKTDKYFATLPYKNMRDWNEHDDLHSFNLSVQLKKSWKSVHFLYNNNNNIKKPFKQSIMTVSAMAMPYNSAIYFSI